jgi:PBP1b-binding outer membrane lipoprotein LpoB
MPITTTARRILALAAFAALATGCSPPKPPDKEQPPEPIAGTAAPAPQDPTALRRAIEQPIDKAKAAEDATATAQKAQQDALDAATGN